jgi:hypothetical protein
VAEDRDWLWLVNVHDGRQGKKGILKALVNNFHLVRIKTNDIV